ncbi:tat pathway signal sequence [Apodospora peruviana]|uniref:Tat pathway signal sequence n=1 Tax=Apodospora peruviana TaxID=516989 RepID=A0AAE0M2A7_9PEZI|nr:tat pathway signal sequence [Apodospora peruviana]
MFWSNSRENRREAWGYEFDWTPEHLTAEQLRPLMFSYDVLATECLDVFDQLSSISSPSTTTASNISSRRTTRSTTKSTSQETTTSTNNVTTSDEQETKKRQGQCPHPDLYALLSKHHASNPTLAKLWTEIHTVPSWVDWPQIARGQKVFYRYAGPSIVSLTFQSLLGGMGSRRVVETLARTGGFGINVARRRLLETFQHILDVTDGLESIKPDGKGFQSSMRVRFLHASVRRRIMRLTTSSSTSSSSYYDINEWGIPISDLDCIATVITFSATLVWMGFPRQGIFLWRQEIEDYIALWRWIAHILGTPTDHLASPEKAKAVMESLLLSEIDPTETSQVLASNIIEGLKEQPPTYASADFLRAEAYWLNGSKLSEALKLPRPSWWYNMLVAGQCLFFMTFCYMKRSVGAWDERSIVKLRVLLRKMTLDQTDGQEAEFAFQYVPSLGKFTTAGTARSNVIDGKKSVERRNLLTVVVASAVVGCTAAWVARSCAFF